MTETEGSLLGGGSTHSMTASSAQLGYRSVVTTSIMIVHTGPSNLGPVTSCIWPGSR